MIDSRSGVKRRLGTCSIIKRAKEIDAILKEGQRLSSQHLSLFVKNSHELRLGFAVSRKIGKAVKRNYAKRRLREMLRKNLNLLPENKSIVILGKPGIESQRFDALNLQLTNLLKKVKALK